MQDAMHEMQAEKETTGQKEQKKVTINSQTPTMVLWKDFDEVEDVMYWFICLGFWLQSDEWGGFFL